MCTYMCTEIMNFYDLGILSLSKVSHTWGIYISSFAIVEVPLLITIHMYMYMQVRPYIHLFVVHVLHVYTYVAVIFKFLYC